MIPLHPERVDRDPTQLRWVVPTGLLPVSSEVLDPPKALRLLVAEGVLAEVSLEPGAVRTRLAHGSWRDHGPAVRAAVQTAVADLHGWRSGVTDIDAGAGADTAIDGAAGVGAQRLWAAVQDVLVGPTGELIRSHGGRVDVLRVTEDTVEVRLSGACSSCPAAASTLRDQLERDLRNRYPALREVRRGDHTAPDSTDSLHSSTQRGRIWRTITRRPDATT